MKETAPLTPAAFHILLALAGGDRHGYAIMQEVETLSEGRMRLGPGTLYRSLQQMLTEDLVAEKGTEAGSASESERRRYYTITTKGRRAARAEVERLSKLVEAARARRLMKPAAQGL